MFAKSLKAVGYETSSSKIKNLIRFIGIVLNVIEHFVKNYLGPSPYYVSNGTE